jgi:hypothetical protein
VVLLHVADKSQHGSCACQRSAQSYLLEVTGYFLGYRSGYRREQERTFADCVSSRVAPLFALQQFAGAMKSRFGGPGALMTKVPMKSF